MNNIWDCDYKICILQSDNFKFGRTLRLEKKKNNNKKFKKSLELQIYQT